MNLADLPAILVALANDPSLPGQGSGRSIPGFDLLAALHLAAPHLIRYGGHQAAVRRHLRDPVAQRILRQARHDSG